MNAFLPAWFADRVRLSIRGKLVLVIMLVCSFGVFFVGAVMTSFTIVTFHSRLKEGIVTDSRMVARNCVAALAFNDPTDAIDVLSSLEALDNLHSAVLYDADGKLFATFARSDSRTEGEIPTTPAEGFAVKDDFMSYSEKIVLDDNAVLGWLTLEYDTRPMMQFFWSVVLTLVVAMGFTCIVAFFVAGLLQRVISKPILELTKDVRLVSKTRDFSLRTIAATEDEIGVLASAFNDVLEQIQLRDAELLESHGRFQSIVEQTPVGVHILNLDQQKRLVLAGFNKAANEILGIDHQQLLGKTVEEAFPGLLDAKDWPKHKQAVLGDKVSFMGELVYDHGSLQVVLELRTFYVSPTTIVGMFTDIAERRREHDALQRRERIMATLAVASHDLLEARNPHDVLSEILQLFGEVASLSRVYLAEAIVGNNGMESWDCNHEWHAENTSSFLAPPLGDQGAPAESLDSWAQRLQQREVVSGTLLFSEDDGEVVQEFLAAPVFVYEVFFGFLAFDAIGPRRVWEQEIDLIQIAAAEIGGALGKAQLLVDVQRHALQLEERVDDRTSELKAVNEELQSFAYSVSHDLRAPLRSINGFSQALVEDYEDVLDATGKSFLQRIQKASGRMAQLIDDLLALSRVTRREIRVQEVDLSTMALESVQELRNIEPDRHVDVSVADKLIAYADPFLIQIVLNNLIGNAWKFCSGEPVGMIEVGRIDSNVERIFYVRDNGAGFDMQYADKLFGAFQRLHAASEFEGTGIGLATVQRIVNRHGGKAWAEAIVGDGATFYFTL